MAVYSILVVDDEANQRLMLADALRASGAEWEVAVAASGREALELLSRRSFSLLITDYQMPEMNGLQLLRAVREQGLTLRAIVISAYELPDARATSDLYAIDSYLTKPVPIATLRLTAATTLAALSSPAAPTTTERS